MKCMPWTAAMAFAIASAAIISIPSAQAQQGQGTKTEQDACRRDVIRYCKDAMPDNFRILACLQQHRPRISAGCQKVLRDNGQ